MEAAINRPALVIFLVSILCIFLIFRGRTLPPWAINNLAMVRFADSLYQAAEGGTTDFKSESLPWFLVQTTALDEELIPLLNSATAFDPANKTLIWTLGRVLLASQKAYDAGEILTPLANQNAANPLVYHELIYALSLSGQHSQVVSLFNQNPELPETDYTNDMVAYALLEQAGGQSLDAVVELRPLDIYANYILWKESEQKDTAYRDNLTRFDYTAVSPIDDRLLLPLFNVIPALLEVGVWDFELTTRVVSFLVWKYPQMPGVQDLLDELVKLYPQQSTFRYLLGELSHRQGNLDIARENYEFSFTLDRNQTDAAYQLWLIAENLGDQQTASYWHNQLEEVVGDAVFLANESVWEALVAQTYNLPADNLQLGFNMLPEGDFEKQEGERLQSWHEVDSRKRNSNEALFLSGLDSLLTSGGKYAARIDGLWREDPSPHYYGFSSVPDQVQGAYWLPVEPHKIYLVSGNFKLSDSDMRASVYLGNPETNLVVDNLQTRANLWQPFVFLGCHTGSETENMQFIIQSQDPGTLWVDNISFRIVQIENAAELCDSLAIS